MQRAAMVNPYDELPYNAHPIEWSAPERLALASMLHGGPRPPVTDYRVLELGCANGANLLPMAWYRKHSTFVGLDNSAGQIETATARTRDLACKNLSFVLADFTQGLTAIEGQFDFILCHGVFSWVGEKSRDALLALCHDKLRPGGLLYFNYNTKPGWTVRGLVREFLVAQTSGIQGLRARVEASQAACQRFVEGMAEEAEHPYRQLMKNELQLVCDAEPSYIAHEYLTAHNRPYWRSELFDLLASHGFAYVADADFNHPWGRVDSSFTDWLRAEGLTGTSIDDTADWLRYRQLHSPIFTTAPAPTRPMTTPELAELHVAACLAPINADSPDGPWRFEHPNGFTVDVTTDNVRAALSELHQHWPDAMPVSDAFADIADVLEDLPLLYRNGLLDLRLGPLASPVALDDPLTRAEREWDGYRTSPLHRWEVADDAP